MAMKTASRKLSALYLLVLASPLAFSAPLKTEKGAKAPTNKLQYMYRFFYLPFSLDFRQGKQSDEILPYINQGTGPRLINAQEMIHLDKEWKAMRAGFRPKSLLLSTAVAVDETSAISNRLYAHVLPLNRSAFDRVSIAERVTMAKALEGKAPEVRNNFRQLQFLKSFIPGKEPARGAFHFFVVSPSWCQSSREYRMLFETFAKRFPQKDFVLHSIVIDDPEEKIFDSRVLGELFPNKEKYSHQNVPKFLALESRNGKLQVWEEGDALEQAYQRFFGQHRGHFDAKSSLFSTRTLATGQAPPLMTPALSSSPLR